MYPTPDHPFVEPTNDDVIVGGSGGETPGNNTNCAARRVCNRTDLISVKPDAVAAVRRNLAVAEAALSTDPDPRYMAGVQVNNMDDRLLHPLAVTDDAARRVTTGGSYPI
jgi:hypothetical protein